jgi:hypothetical protein
LDAAPKVQNFVMTEAKSQKVDMTAVTSYLEEITGQSLDAETQRVRNLITEVKPKPQTAQKISVQKNDLEFLVILIDVDERIRAGKVKGRRFIEETWRQIKGND